MGLSLLLAYFANFVEAVDEYLDGSFEGAVLISDSNYDSDHDSNLGSISDEAAFGPRDLFTYGIDGYPIDVDGYPIDVDGYPTGTESDPIDVDGYPIGTDSNPIVIENDELHDDSGDDPRLLRSRHSCQSGYPGPCCETCGTSHPPVERGDPELREHYSLDDCESVCGEEGASFPHFNRLPPELRCIIWEMYCPDLRAPARFLEFQIESSSGCAGLHDDASRYVALPGSAMGNSTRRIRKLLAVHRESRALVMRTLPDSLAFSYTANLSANRRRDGKQKGGLGTVRFHGERDVVMLNNLPVEDRDWFDRPNWKPFLDEFTRPIQKVAFLVMGYLDPHSAQGLRLTLRQFPQLKDVHYATLFAGRLTGMGSPIPDVTWIRESFIQGYTIHKRDPELLCQPFRPEFFCWPDADKAPDFRALRLAEEVECFEPLAAEEGWRLLPMICFTGLYYLRDHRAMMDKQHAKEMMRIMWARKEYFDDDEP